MHTHWDYFRFTKFIQTIYLYLVFTEALSTIDPPVATGVNYAFASNVYLKILMPTMHSDCNKNIPCRLVYL